MASSIDFSPSSHASRVSDRLSRRFLYKTTRRLLGWQGDRGAYLRTTMQAMVAFGIPPEKFCKYDIANFDAEPDAFLYSMAQSYQALTYYRLDPFGTPPEKILNRPYIIYRIRFQVQICVFSMVFFQACNEIGIIRL